MLMKMFQLSSAQGQAADELVMHNLMSDPSQKPRHTQLSFHPMEQNSLKGNRKRDT